MQSGGAENDAKALSIDTSVDRQPSRWESLLSMPSAFLSSPPVDSNDLYGNRVKQLQSKKPSLDSEKLRIWSPQDDLVFSGSTDSDNSGSYREPLQLSINVHDPLQVSSLPPIVTSARRTESPIDLESKWAPQSPESSRFFTNNPDGRELPNHYFGLEAIDKRPPDSSPNAVAVAHGSPLDLSFPVRDSRSEIVESSMSTSLGLGIAQGQRRGSHGDHSSAAFSPKGSPGKVFLSDNVQNFSSPSTRGIYDSLQQERHQSRSQSEAFAPATFPSLSSTVGHATPSKGNSDGLESMYGFESIQSRAHGDADSWTPQRKDHLKGLNLAEEASPFESFTRPAGLYHGHSSNPSHESSHRQTLAGRQQNHSDVFAMDAMQQSLRAVSTTAPPSQMQHLQLQTHHPHSQQQLPPRSPQMQGQMIHQGLSSYFSPARGPPNVSPITTNAFSHPVAQSDYYPHSSQGQHSQGGNSLPGSPFIGNSRVTSPVNSEYGYSCGSAGYSQAAFSHSQQSSSDKHSQRHSQTQQHLETFLPFSSIDQHSQHPYDGCIYQVQFKRSHRCLILSSSAPQGIKPGDFVIVEADRGEDLGVVVSMAPRDSPLAATIFAACSSSMRGPDSEFLKKILRMASYQERMDLPRKAQEEMDLLEVCRERAREMYSLPMSLVDAEYQFDRHKLILYYSASRRIDFREFVRDLFAIYKTRIWMEQATAHHSFRPSETAARALSQGVLHHNHSPLTLPPSASGSSCPSPSARDGNHMTSTNNKLLGMASLIGELHQRERPHSSMQGSGYQGHGLDDFSLDMKHSFATPSSAPSHPHTLQQYHDNQYIYQNQPSQSATQYNSIQNVPGYQLSQNSHNQNFQRDDQQLLRLQRDRYNMEL